jgi:AcrR family transcriptional regulator
MSLRKVKAAGSPRQRFSTEERQDEIVRAAVDLAGTQGVDNVTTQGIAEVIGVTQGAIFRHFPSKDTIWIAVVHWARGRLMSVVDMAASQATDPIDALESIFYAHIGFAEKNPAVPRLLLSTSPHLKLLLQETVAGYEAKLSGLLGDARTRGLVRADLDEQSAAMLFVGIIQGLVTRVLILGPKKPLLGEARKIWPIYLAGIGGRSAHGSGKAKRQRVQLS